MCVYQFVLGLPFGLPFVLPIGLPLGWPIGFPSVKTCLLYTFDAAEEE